MLRSHKYAVIFLDLVALMLFGFGQVLADYLLFDRGLPTANLNNVAGANRSNVAWASDNSTSPYTLIGDDFSIGTAGQTYHLDKITLWTVFSNTDLRLWGGAQGQNISVISTDSTVSQPIFYNVPGNITYQGASGSYRDMYQVDFAVNLNVNGGQTYQFFIDGLSTYGVNLTPFLHASNAALSGSPQDGADNLFLELTMTNGVPGAVVSVDSKGNGWSKSSDINVQVYGSQVPLPGTLLLLSSGLAGLGLLRGRKFFKA